ncbi:Crp/Fnr family transcriptional regulator [Reyranella sp.]|uniref:Crp/Fnr family transcriptional regulator n=1 Tax=Reyranella sp. TaxID=1929291 RepID=UPI0025F37F77|nr:Crp/Fnr family transcriptional regulator [Reyranella sp.]
MSKKPAGFKQAVLERCQLRKVRAGTTIYRIGDHATGLYGVGAGRVGIEIAPAERAPYLAFFAEPGAWLGYRGVITGFQQAGLKATRDSELLFLPKQAIDDLIREVPGRWRMFARLSLSDLQKVTSLLDDVLRRDHAQRVAAILLHFGGCRQVTPPDARRIDLEVGQEEVARIANIGRTVTGAVLRDLEKAGHIELAYRRIQVLAPDVLRSQLSE